MKINTNISVLFSMLLFSSIAQGQVTYQKYVRPKSPFQLDTVFNSTQTLKINSEKNHIWLNALNSQYTDTTKNKINSSAIPIYTPIKKNALTNPYNPLNQFICAMLPYGYYFPSDLYGLDTYGSYSRTYPTFPHRYSPYNIKATGSPYYILPKF